MPKQGPRDGSLNAMRDFFPSFAMASPRPTVTVVFPSPAGVGLMAVTSISFPSSLSETFLISSLESFALYFPYISMSSSAIPIDAATSLIFAM